MDLHSGTEEDSAFCCSFEDLDSVVSCGTSNTLLPGRPRGPAGWLLRCLPGVWHECTLARFRVQAWAVRTLAKCLSPAMVCYSGTTLPSRSREESQRAAQSFMVKFPCPPGSHSEVFFWILMDQLPDPCCWEVASERSKACPAISLPAQVPAHSGRVDNVWWKEACGGCLRCAVSWG